MTREQAVRAILTGADLAVETAEMGAQVVGVGEMGIGNTTTSSAVLSVLTDTPVIDVTGRGAGLTDEAYEKKIGVILKAIAVNDLFREATGDDGYVQAGLFVKAETAENQPEAVAAYLELAAKYDWDKVICNEGENPRSIEAIHSDVYAIVEKLLKK